MITTKPTDPIGFHDSLAANWELKYTKRCFRGRAQAFLSLLDPGLHCDQAWLDAGCGTGVLARELSSRGLSVTGVDASRKMIDEANRLTPRSDGAMAREPVFDLVDTVEHLDFPGSSFDGIVCSSVVEYLKNPVEAIVQFHRILKPGGVLLVSVPNRTSPVRSAQRVLHLVSSCFKTPWPAYLTFSNHSYTRRTFSNLLRDCGFEVVSRIDYDPYMPGFISKMGFNAAMMIFLGKKRSP